MSRGKKSNDDSHGRLLARLAGMLLMAVIFVVLVVIGLRFMKVLDGGKDSTAKPDRPQSASEARQEKPRYDFYQELTGRKQEIDAEVRRRAQNSGNLAPVKGSNYRIQVGAFRDPEQADRMRARMILRDYPVGIIRNGNFHLVQIGPYKDKAQAAAVQRQLQKEGVDTLLKVYVGD